MKNPGQRALKARAVANRGESALSALDIALNAIDAPAFVVDLGGEVVHANSNALTLMAQDRQRVARSLVRAIEGAPADPAWDLTPLRGTPKRQGFLAILRARRPEPAAATLLEAATRRWHLTARQTQVLDLVVRGFTNALIADTLGVGEGTVEFHLSAIFDKAGVESRAMLIVTLIAKVNEP